MKSALPFLWRISAWFRRSPRLITLSCGLVLVSLPAVRAAETGTLAGSVSNSVSGNMLEGARVEIPQLGLRALTDNTGRFVLPALPAGTHEIVASYLGLDPIRSQVTIASGQRAVRDFGLTAAIYQLEEFKVTGEREGGAAAITAQRNADNVKNVVAMDSFGNLPNMGTGELVIRLPGVAANLHAEGHVTGIIVRGMSPGLNTVTVDGSLMSSEGGMGRSFNMSFLTGAMFDQLELVKGHTPDKGAEGLGGSVNMKTRSTLSLTEKRRVTYNISARWAPPFAQHIPLRQAHRIHPLFNFAYQEVFDVFGGKRNLGVAVTTFYSENAAGYFRTNRDFQNTTGSPAYLWDYRTQEIYNNRKQGAFNVKVDYRLSPATKFSLSTIINEADEPAQRRYEVRAFTTQAIGTSGTAGILPGYTDRITQVRAAPGSTIDMTAVTFSFYNRLRAVEFGTEHDLGRLQLDYNAGFNRAHINAASSNGGELIHRVTGVGWIMDRTQSDLYPRFVQTEGPDFTDPSVYRPAANGLSNRNNANNHDVHNVRGNARYTLPTSFASALKTGFNWRRQVVENVNLTRRWSYIGTTALPTDPSIVTWDSLKSGRKIPQWDASMFLRHDGPADPSLWREDVYFRESTTYTGTRVVTEKVSAAYLMGQARVRRTGFLTGVRTEKTEMNSAGWVRAAKPSSSADQANDPVGAARRDYAGTRREISGSYTKSFPSAHLTHDITNNLKARLSWSTSFGRPAMSNALPNETPNDTEKTLTINNPALLPQMATNWDATLDYYFEPVGNLSVGFFHKTIKDYIVSGTLVGTVGTGLDNGYNGEFSSYTLRTSANAGTAFAQGWEISYQQQFTFLPGLFKGLGVSGNYTLLETHGNFGDAVYRSTNQIAGFIPRTGNLSLFWRYRAFNARMLANYTGDALLSYNATSPSRNQYRVKRTAVNLSLSYQLNPSLSLNCDVTNLFNEPQMFYRGTPDQREGTFIHGSTISMGVSGRF